MDAPATLIPSRACWAESWPPPPGFVAVGILRWPLRYLLLVLAPVSIALAAWVLR